MVIKKFDEFNNGKINEGLFGAFRGKMQILKVQGLVADEYENLIQEDPKKFNDGKSVLKAVEQFARDTYKKIVTAEGTITFEQWWKNFTKSHIHMLDNTVFNKTKEK
jgi:hypothetical protein